MNIFSVRKLNYKYDKYNKAAKQTLSDLSFDIEKGSFVAIIGRTGSGKSTLISHLNGLLKADSGDILYNGESIYAKAFSLHDLRFKCGIVFQYPEYQLFSETVLEDISFGAIKKGLSKEEAEKKSMEVMDLLGIKDLKDESPFILSGGEKRKVAFAGVLVMDPEVLILDEPEAGLDPISKKEFFELLIKLNKEKGVTIIFITHNLDDVCEYADRVLVMYDGVLKREGTPIEIFTDDKLLSECRLDTPHAIEIYKQYGIEEPISCRYDDVLKAVKDKLKSK